MSQKPLTPEIRVALLANPLTLAGTTRHLTPAFRNKLKGITNADVAQVAGCEFPKMYNHPRRTYWFLSTALRLPNLRAYQRAWLQQMLAEESL